MLRCTAALALIALVACVTGSVAAAKGYTNFETVPVRPLALSPDGSRLFAVNTPDARLEIFAVVAGGLARVTSVPVGLEPVAVAARSESEVWVVNHLSDSVSVVDVGSNPPRVVRTLLVGDEPWDVVFGGERTNVDLPFPRAFVSATRRGQNHPEDVHSNYKTPGVGRADVWVFDARNLGMGLGGQPEKIIQLFGDKPRALEVSPDGSVIFAAVFHSGNQTTSINPGAVCDGGPDRGPCVITQAGIDDPPVVGESGEGSPPVLPGGLPAPRTDAEGVPGEEVGLIVKYNPASGRWEDELGRNWNGAVPFALPDFDVLAIDARADDPAEVEAYSGVGTINFDIAVHPDGRLYVANTEARNEVRFEGSGERGTTVRGHLHEARVTMIDDLGVHPRHLNKHIDYDVTPVPAGVTERSLSQPVGLALTEDGSTLYVAAFGSDAIGVFDTLAIDGDTFVPSAEAQIPVSGGGPAGLVVDETHERLFVYTRFDNGLSVIDLESEREIGHLPLHNPEPAEVLAGRRFLYDARLSASNGESACGSCHVFADKDDLAWDLGNPDGVVVKNENPFVVGDPDQFHPLKGPMTTQTLRGMENHGPMHWRGDRSGALDPDNGSASDEHAAFMAFNGAFEGLLGRDEGQISDAEMSAFADFALTIFPPPNPIRPLDNLDTPRIASGRNTYTTFPANLVGTCNRCHVLAPLAGFFGTAGLSVFDPGDFKIPHLRNVYDKVGAFGFVGFNSLGNAGPRRGDQIRGTGLGNDGSLADIDTFLLFAGFNFPSEEAKDEVEDFVLEFPSNMAPIVGQQVTLTEASSASAHARVDLLIQQAQTPWVVAGNRGDMSCDLVVHGVVGDEARGWFLDVSTGLFQGNRAADAQLSDETLRARAAEVGQELTYTCMPPGAALRLGADRDGDGTWDGDERDLGTDPAAAGSVPGACSDGIDNDGDGAIDHPADPDCVSAEANSELPGPITVEIDVMPRSRRNIVRLTPGRLVAVMLFGSERVDVDEIDVGSLAFGPEGAPVRNVAWSSRRRIDRNRDGFPDLSLRFRASDSGLQAGDEQACLRGALRGEAFEACDTVVVRERYRPLPRWFSWLKFLR